MIRNGSFSQLFQPRDFFENRPKKIERIFNLVFLLVWLKYAREIKNWCFPIYCQKFNQIEIGTKKEFLSKNKYWSVESVSF